MKTISVIASKCNGSGGNLHDQAYNNLLDARIAAENLRASNLSVIIRPNYNEKDADGSFYREWRSFNGEEFQEVRFGF
jgi:hypothetical protein